MVEVWQKAAVKFTAGGIDRCVGRQEPGGVMQRRIFTFLAVLAVPLSLIVALAVPASAAETPPALSPAQGPPGTTVTASAADWSGCSLMSVSGWGETLGITSINASGAFSLSFTVPGGAALGAAQLQFSPTCSHSTYMPFVTFTVTQGTSNQAPPVLTCPTAWLFGLHGMGEGPSGTIASTSATIAFTFSAFKSDAASRGIAGVKTSAFAYPTVSVSDIMSLSGFVNGPYHIGITATNAADALQANLQEISAQCPSTPVLLVGYSMGAWVIDNMLSVMSQNPGNWDNIKAVMLYGDPCWYNKSGKYQGLAREEYATCGTASTYPYPAPSNTLPFKVQSVCYYNDPVCGQGFSVGGPLPAAVRQVSFAGRNCRYTPSATTYGKCPHYDYEVGGPKKGSTAEGASFLAPFA